MRFLKKMLSNFLDFRKYFNDVIFGLDARYIVVINHVILISTAVMFFGLRRSWEQMGLAIAVAVIAELVLSKITQKQKQFDIKDRILSAIVLALGAILLVRSPYWWFYAFIAFVGVLSKYIIVNDKGRHIFNPTNVAIVFGIIVLPEFLNVRIDSFSTHIFSLCCVVFFGTLAIIKADSWRITLGYFMGICLIGIPAAYIMDLPLLLILGPEANVGVLLFAFLMMTDPQTSPREKKAQWIFGFIIAAVNLFLRYEQLYYSPFISLFIVSSFAILLYRSPGLTKKSVNEA